MPNKAVGMSVIDRLPLIPLVPRYEVSAKERSQRKDVFKSVKEPKFVPYEPYKACVVPIIKNRSPTMIRSCGGGGTAVYDYATRNNAHINDLAMQIANLRSQELEKANSVETLSDSDAGLRNAAECDRKMVSALETDVRNLRESNAMLENQLKFQTQVNHELKTLLVAAVGEDLETRVQHLTEDKLQLARALLSSTTSISSHREQTDWLTSQCEVWKSKFLASSLMVEELARWTNSLSERINVLHQHIKLLLDEYSCIRSDALLSHCKLTAILKHSTNNQQLSTLNAFNTIDVGHSNKVLTDQLGEVFGFDADLYDELAQMYSKSLPSQPTPQESRIQKIMDKPVLINSKQEAVCQALAGSIISVKGQQLFMHHASNNAGCCNCKGDISNV